MLPLSADIYHPKPWEQRKNRIRLWRVSNPVGSLIVLPGNIPAAAGWRNPSGRFRRTMRLRTLFLSVAIISSSACGPIVRPPATATPSPVGGLPDLVVSSIYLGMQGVPGYPGCVPGYAPYEIRAVIRNAGSAPARDVSVVEQSTQHQIQIGTLQPMQSIEVPIPLSPAGSYTVVVDPANVVTESDESNNVSSYLAPTPTPPALCTPAPATLVPSPPSATPSPQAP